MTRSRLLGITLLGTALFTFAVVAQQPAPPRPAAADDALRAAPPLARMFSLEPYTQYAMLDDPGTNAFRVTYMPFEDTVGATLLINGTRHGSDGGDVEVYDPRTGKPAKFDYLTGVEMIAQKVPGRYTPEDHYIKAQLPWPVPEGGEGRVLIYKTYKDARTYYADGADTIVWVRGLSAHRVGLVLPKGYSLVSSNIAAGILGLSDGRLKLSIINPSGGGSPLTLRARKTGTVFAATTYKDVAFEDMRTLYDLGDPASHAMSFQSIYTDWRKGDKARVELLSYANLQDLKVIDLDTAKPLPVAKDGNATTAKLEVPIQNEHQSAHLKVTGKLQDAAYRVDQGDLVFERTLHGVRNTVLLPAGWDVAGVSQPANIGMAQGRAFVAFINHRAEDTMRVSIRGRKRGSTATQ